MFCGDVDCDDDSFAYDDELSDSDDEFSRLELESELYSQIHYTADDTPTIENCVAAGVYAKFPIKTEPSPNELPAPKRRKLAGQNTSIREDKAAVDGKADSSADSLSNRKRRVSFIDLCSDHDSDSDGSTTPAAGVLDDIFLNVHRNDNELDLSNLENVDHNLTLEDIQASLGECNWDVEPKKHVGFLGRGHRRYYSSIDVHCKNCNKLGHLSRECPSPKKAVTCILCSREGHIARVCPDALCFNCHQPGHMSYTCPAPRQSRFVMCSRCSGRGHTEANCPEIWRQYHLTTTGGTLVCGSSKKKNTNKKKFCCNCARKGHFVHECKQPMMDKWRQPVSVFVSFYQLDHPTTWNVNNTTAQNDDNKQDGLQFYDLRNMLHDRHEQQNESVESQPGPSSEITGKRGLKRDLSGQFIVPQAANIPVASRNCSDRLLLTVHNPVVGRKTKAKRQRIPETQEQKETRTVSIVQERKKVRRRMITQYKNQQRDRFDSLMRNLKQEQNVQQQERLQRQYLQQQQMFAQQHWQQRQSLPKLSVQQLQHMQHTVPDVMQVQSNVTQVQPNVTQVQPNVTQVQPNVMQVQPNVKQESNVKQEQQPQHVQHQQQQQNLRWVLGLQQQNPQQHVQFLQQQQPRNTQQQQQQAHVNQQQHSLGQQPMQQQNVKLQRSMQRLDDLQQQHQHMLQLVNLQRLQPRRDKKFTFEQKQERRLRKMIHHNGATIEKTAAKLNNGMVTKKRKRKKNKNKKIKWNSQQISVNGGVQQTGISVFVKTERLA